MGEASGAASDQPAHLGPQAPCVYCGQVIDRTADRCPHCRTSYSFAVRKASREVVGDWFYLDPRNPSGRGVSFETLIKMIEKGRIKRDSVVRGPTTHYDWMYAAEAPRLAKYLGLCPHCFAEAKPEDTYCNQCQLNMNERPADARPGATPDEIRDPVHKAAYQMEERLADAARAEHETAAPPRPASAAAAAPVRSAAPARPHTPRGEPKTSSAAQAAAAALAESASDRPSRVAPVVTQRSRPKLWIVLILTWVTLVPIYLVLAYAVDGLPLHDTLTGGGATVPPENPPTPKPPGTDAEWLRTRLAEADQAEQQKDYDAAIAIYEDIIARTGDVSWRQRINTLRAKPEEERQARLQQLRDRLQTADDLSSRGRYDDALAVLRNIVKEDRSLLASLGVGVENMEKTIEAAKAKTAEAERRKELANRLAQAVQLRLEDKLPEALAAYEAIGQEFDAALVSQQIDLAKVVEELKTQIAAASKPPDPMPPGPEPEPLPEAAAKAVADLLTKAADFEQQEKFAEALTTLEEIKTKFDQKFWPDQLEDRIRQVKAKKEALEFFGMDGGATPDEKKP